MRNLNHLKHYLNVLLRNADYAFVMYKYAKYVKAVCFLKHFIKKFLVILLFQLIDIVAVNYLIDNTAVIN